MSQAILSKLNENNYEEKKTMNIKINPIIYG